MVDVGCGTGSLAVLLAADGLAVTGVDPARASLDVARGKAHAEVVTWVHGTAADLPPLATDTAVMHGNVAQVCVTDEAWTAALRGIRGAMRRGGVLVFESRQPERRAWGRWEAETGGALHEVPGIGEVRQRPTGFEVALPLVTFSAEFVFADGRALTSTSLLRWRDEPALRPTPAAAGFAVAEARAAPARPRRECVVLARALQP